MAVAKLKNYRQSPRKVRLVADFIRGKKAQKALDELKFVNKRVSEAIQKLLKSAIANAVQNDKLDVDSLRISEIRIDDGVTLKRIRARARGRAARILKRTSNISLKVESLQV
jgi:large subunit ribosomal protein L22